MKVNLKVESFEKLQGNTSDSQMAKILGINRTQLWRIKKGKCSPGEKFTCGFKSAFPNEKIDNFLTLVLQESDTLEKRDLHIG